MNPKMFVFVLIVLAGCQSVEHDLAIVGADKPSNSRISRAVELQELLGLSAPIMVDNMDNIGWESIGNRPNSATLISKDGTVLEHQKWFDNENIRHVVERHLSQ